MSLQLTAIWLSAELPLNVTATGNTDFEWGANNSFAFTAGFLSELQDETIRTDVAGVLGANDSLSYQGILQVLDAAAVGGMTASKFGTLETLVSLMSATGGISTSAYVQNISHSLIDGDPANAYWTGGASMPIALGNLSATSTQAQVDDLIGKWFLGSDLPSIDLKGSSESTYQVYNAPLFGAGNVPSYLDVNQGHLGDCWFVATLAEVALQNPAAIESMITNNGNGTYGVRFFVDGTPEYVTVNDDLPTASTPLWANGSSLEFANGANGEPSWAELVEKAFAQLNAEPNAVHGELGLAINAYEGIAGGWPQDALAEITDQDSITFHARQLVSNAATIGAAFESGEEVELSTGTLPKGFHGDLVQHHVFEVIGYSAGTETFTLHNPWGSASSQPMTFTLSVHELAAARTSMHVAEGTASSEVASAFGTMETSIASVVGAGHGPLGHFLL
jgi:hypothetical protein